MLKSNSKFTIHNLSIFVWYFLNIIIIPSANKGVGLKLNKLTTHTWTTFKLFVTITSVMRKNFLNIVLPTLRTLELLGLLLNYFQINLKWYSVTWKNFNFVTFSWTFFYSNISNILIARLEYQKFQPLRVPARVRVSSRLQWEGKQNHMQAESWQHLSKHYIIMLV